MSNRVPFFLKHRRRLLIAAALMVPVGYVASYPVVYRVLVGSDANAEHSVPMNSGCIVYYQPSAEAWQRWSYWVKLERYYYPPVEWLLDRTLLQTPLLFLARVIDVDEQLAGDVKLRKMECLLKSLEDGNNKFENVVQELAVEQ